MSGNDSKVFREGKLIGKLQKGRINMGDTIPVGIYRLFESCMREALDKQIGPDACIEAFREAGRIAGAKFYKEYLYEASSTVELLTLMKSLFVELKMGIVRVESIREDEKIILTISEDLDCSGLPIIGETVCHYDEGFLEGILKSYSHKDYEAIEIDCWAKGDRVCRFDIKPKEE